MVKQVSGSEFLVTKKEVMATKLNEDDQVLFVKEIEEPYTQLILKSKKGMFHRFLIEEIPTKKKGAIGVRGMQLSKDDFLETYWLVIGQAGETICYEEKVIAISRVKLAKRDGKGTKLRL
ncbi:MAG: hypothetical protein IAC13_01570 [Firmicutes bacterium]|uniref:Uncharacterized protein n=1 Tax=Candidatus Scybalomonas excrementavium TaxID=2840943 RepID=A0A9D9N6R4_9FIRM|nr:hypothetical protein [Candidatus Scybalomonas excrementavium]